jgi:hypothetical protein
MGQVFITVNAIIANEQISRTVLKKVTDSQGQDVTDKFKEYCNNKKLPIETQIELEQAAELFSKENSSWLP